MGGANQASGEPSAPVFESAPVEGVAWEQDAATTLVSTSAELAAVLKKPCGTRNVQLLSQTYDLTGLLNSLTVVSVQLRCVGPRPAVIVGTTTLLLKCAVTKVTFQGMSLELDGRVNRLDQVTCDGVVTSTVENARLVIKDCVFTGVCDLGVGEFHIIDCEFLSLDVQPRCCSEIKTCIFNGRLTATPGTSGQLFIHGGLFRAPSTTTGEITLLDVASTGASTVITHCVFDLEETATPTDLFNLVRLSPNATDQMFLNATTVQPNPNATLPSVTNYGTHPVRVGTHNLPTAVFSGTFTNLNLGPS